MDSKRLLKLFATLWWLIALVAVAGAATAFFVTRWQNSLIEEKWEATAPVLILKTSDESDADYESRLRLTENRARLAVETSLSDNDHGYVVAANAGQARLEFGAANRDPGIAEDLAEGLRAMYLVAEPTDGIVEQLVGNLNDLEVQVLALRGSRDALVAETPVDPSVATQLALMESQLATLRQRSAALSLALLFPELGIAVDEEGIALPELEVRTDLAATTDVIERLEQEYSSLNQDSPESAAPEEGLSLELLVIDQQIRDLESEYIETALTIEELKGGGSTSVLSNTTEVVNTTPGAASPTSAGLLGLVLGAVLASGLIIGTDKMRRAVLGTEDDLALPIVATVDPSRPGAEDDQPWYPSATGRRRGDVQAVRAALDGLMTQGSVTIGLSGLGASDASVQDLAADLATSVAASGREVLLIDTVFESPSNLPEYASSGPSLAEMVTPVAASASRQDLKVLIGDRDYITPEMRALQAGSLAADPVDAVAGRLFREILEVAKDFAEVIIVAAPHWGFPQAEVLAQRLDYFVLVGRSGVTTAVDVENAAGELALRNARAVGMVLLVGRSVGMVVLGARGPLGIGPSRRRRRRAALVTIDDNERLAPDDALDERPPGDFVEADARDGAGAAVGGEAESLRGAEPVTSTHGNSILKQSDDPVGPVGHASKDETSRDEAAAASTPTKLAYSRSDESPDRAAGTEIVEAFLIERIDYLVTHGIDRDAIDGHPTGMLLMPSDRYSDGAAAVLHTDIIDSASGRSAELEESLRRVLGSGASSNGREDLVGALDRWIHRRLIESKRELAVGNPIWHLSSDLGTFQALVNGSTFDAARAAELRSQAVGQQLERLKHRDMLEGLHSNMRRQEGRGGDRPSNLRTQIADVERFAEALEDLGKTAGGGVFTRAQLDAAGVLSPRHWAGS